MRQQIRLKAITKNVIFLWKTVAQTPTWTVSWKRLRRLWRSLGIRRRSRRRLFSISMFPIESSKNSVSTFANTALLPLLMNSLRFSEMCCFIWDVSIILIAGWRTLSLICCGGKRLVWRSRRKAWHCTQNQDRHPWKTKNSRWVVN